MLIPYDLTRLDETQFENLVNDIARRVLGNGATGFGPGSDGGRDGYFHGKASYPSTAEQWDGVWYIQAKYHRPHLTTDAQKWVLDKIREELAAFADANYRRIWPDIWIFATNVDPSGVPQTGSFDRAREMVKQAHSTLEPRFHIWGGAKLISFLNEFPDIAKVYGLPIDRDATRRLAYKYGFPKPDYFTGREKELSELHDLLNPSAGGGSTVAVTQGQVISGLGGIGKTTLAMAYGYRYEEEYDYLLFASAERETSLLQAYRDIAAQVGNPLPAQADPATIGRTIKQLLNSTPRWLLILDNVDFTNDLTPKRLKEFLPERPQGHILLTSRLSRFAGLNIPFLSLEMMPEDEAARFLTERVDSTGRRISASEAQAARELARELDGLPLALEQAAAYMATRRQSFSIYLANYRALSLELLNRQRPETNDYPHTVETTWQINVEAVEAESKASAELLRLAAFLSPDAVPIEVVWAAASVEGKILPAIVAYIGKANTDEARQDCWDRLLEPLVRYSLIQKYVPQNVDSVSEETKQSIEQRNKRLMNTFSLHRLVQLVQRSGLSKAGRKKWCKQATSVLARTFYEAGPDDGESLERLVAHAQVLAGWLREQPKSHSEDGGYVMNQAGRQLGWRGQYTQAESLILDSITIYRRIVPENPDYTAPAINNLGLLYLQQGRYSEAEPQFLEVLLMRRQSLPAGHPLIATALNNLGLLYLKQGRYSEAEPLFREALAMRQQALSMGLPLVGPVAIAESINNLASIDLEQDRFKEAEQGFSEALEMRRAALPKVHRYIADSLNNLAKVCLVQGRHREAKSLLDESLEMRRTIWPEAHPDTAKNLYYLAEWHRIQLSYEEAEDLFKESLRMGRAFLPPGHPDTAKSLRQMSVLFADQGRYEEAALFVHEVMQILKENLGVDHPETRMTAEYIEALENKRHS